MRFRVRLHPLVESDLNVLAARVTAFAGPAAAERRLADFEALRQALADMPHRGTLRDDVAPALRTVPAGRSLVVAFRVDDVRREVLILAVSHGGSDWMGRARSREP